MTIKNAGLEMLMEIIAKQYDINAGKLVKNLNNIRRQVLIQ